MIEKTHKLMTDLSAFNSKSENLILKLKDFPYVLRLTAVNVRPEYLIPRKAFPIQSVSVVKIYIHADANFIWPHHIFQQNLLGYKSLCTPQKCKMPWRLFSFPFHSLWAFLFNTKSFNNIPFPQMVPELLCLSLPQMDAKRLVYHLYRKSQENQSAKFHTINTAFEFVADSVRHWTTNLKDWLLCCYTPLFCKYMQLCLPQRLSIFY